MDKTIVRSAASVVAGYLVFAVSAAIMFKVSRHDPHAPASTQFMVLSTVYGVLFAGLGGFIAVKLSSSRSLKHAIAVAVLIAAGAMFSLFASPDTGAKWSQLSAVLLMAPAALAGGAMGVPRAKNGSDAL